MIRLLPLLLLAGCAHVPANCNGAEKARMVALVALQAIDRVCPAPLR